MARSRDGLENGWYLDKRVPIALIVTLVLQGAGVIWWGSQVSIRLDMVERAAQSPERLARMETLMEGVRAQIDRLERKLDRQARLDPPGFMAPATPVQPGR